MEKVQSDLSVRNIGVTDLQVGMHVMLPTSWFKHPFLHNHFRLSSKEEIEKLMKCGFTYVKVDFSKSLSHRGKRAIEELTPRPIPRKWKPGDIVPHELVEVLSSKSVSPERKATVVKQSSLVLMERLLEDPSTENLNEAKKGIFRVVDCIISDDDTSHCLLDITNHDFYTYTHSVNVGIFALLLAKKLFNGLNGHNIRELGAGFFLHDLGKVSIDSSIINKRGKLTEKEMKAMRRHPMEGARMLSDSRHLNEENKIIVLQHHERQDGSGYPNGLRGESIHLYAKICSIADVYDALHSERPYKERLDPFHALKLMRDQMINHFQRDLFENFVTIFA